MRLEKAREIIQLNIKEAGTKMPPDVKTALIIHVEAADRVLLARKESCFVGPSLLPTETEE